MNASMGSNHRDLVFGAIAMLAAACGATDNGSSSGEPQAPIVGGAGGQGVVDGGASNIGGNPGGSAGAEPTCLAPEPAPLGQLMRIDSVHAMLVDQFDDPAENVACLLCGIGLCGQPASSNATGQITVFGPGADQKDPRLNVSSNAAGYAKMVGLIPAAPSYDFGKVRVLRLPPFSTGAELVPGHPATSGGVTLTPQGNAVVEFDQVTYSEQWQRVFIAALWDIRGINPTELPAIEPILDLELLIGTGPFDTHICPPAAMRFENIIGWEPGTAVEIFVNGATLVGNYAPWGQWAPVAEAVVDPGGATVSTKPGSGIAVLGTFGARPKP